MIQTLFGSLEEQPSFLERMKEAVTRTRENLAERIEDVVSIGKEIDRPTLNDLEATLISVASKSLSVGRSISLPMETTSSMRSARFSRVRVTASFMRSRKLGCSSRLPKRVWIIRDSIGNAQRSIITVD